MPGSRAPLPSLPDKALIGVLHVPPMPGGVADSHPIDDITSEVTREARFLADHGFDGLILENFGDAPFQRGAVAPHTVAYLTRLAVAVRNLTTVPLGINVLRNDARSAVAIASAAEAAFIRVNIHVGVYATDQGVIEGDASATLHYRRQLQAPVAILADVHVKHAVCLSQPDIAMAAEETAWRGRADGLIVTGDTTGRVISPHDLERVRAAVPGVPVFIGSGVVPSAVAEALSCASGIIVGSSLRLEGHAGAALCPQRVAAFVRAAGR